MKHLQEMSKDDLLKLVDAHAKSWLAHDGCWFLAAEEKYGMATAIELDTKSWERFSAAEARRIMASFGVPKDGRLDSLEKALWLRLYAAVNPQKVSRPAPGRLTLKVLDCRVQEARRRKKLPDFPCKSVGMVEYSVFARTIDPRIKTKCLTCPPDPVAEGFCSWEFTL